MKLRTQLQQQERGLVQLWLERTLESYSSDGARFMAGQKDRFANPVGHTLRVGLADVLAKWIAGAAPSELAAALDPVIRVRSVQNLSPGQAVAFVLLLKGAVRDKLGLTKNAADHVVELAELDAEVDRLLLVAFDVYGRCRDQIQQLRVDEVKRRVSGLLRRVGWGDETSGPDEPTGGASPP